MNNYCTLCGRAGTANDIVDGQCSTDVAQCQVMTAQRTDLPVWGPSGVFDCLDALMADAMGKGLGQPGGAVVGAVQGKGVTLEIPSLMDDPAAFMEWADRTCARFEAPPTLPDYLACGPEAQLSYPDLPGTVDPISLTEDYRVLMGYGFDASLCALGARLIGMRRETQRKKTRKFWEIACEKMRDCPNPGTWHSRQLIFKWPYGEYAETVYVCWVERELWFQHRSDCADGSTTIISPWEPYRRYNPEHHDVLVQVTYGVRRADQCPVLHHAPDCNCDGTGGDR